MESKFLVPRDLVSDLPGSFDELHIHGLEKESDEVKFTFIKKFWNHNVKWELKFFHSQDCCENVRLVDFENDLIEKSGDNEIRFLGVGISTRDANDEEIGDSCGSWTFYRVRTNLGEVFLRFLGESNGYYSTEVDYTFKKVT